MADKNALNKNISLAEWKLRLISQGVFFDDPFLFNRFPKIDRYKTKYRILKPQSNKLKVFDFSKDESIIPAEVIINDNQQTSVVKLRYNAKSPLKIIINKQNQIFIKNKLNKKTIPAKLIKIKKYQFARLPKSIDKTQPKLSNFVDIVGQDRLSILTFDGCWNWNSGKPCHFCDLNPKREDYISARPNLNTLVDYEIDVHKWWSDQKKKYLNGIKYSFNYLLKHEKILPHRHLLIMSGNLPESIYVWNIASDIIKTLNTVEPVKNFDNYLNICPHPNLNYLNDFKKLGVKQIQYNLEVIGEPLFKKMCPGKANYQLFKNKLIEAVGVMGFGNVRSNFVLGLQPIDDLLSGIKELAKQGVVADYSIFQPKRGTPLENLPAPKIKTIMNFTVELANIYRKYGFKPIYCNFSSRSSIINEHLCSKNILQN